MKTDSGTAPIAVRDFSDIVQRCVSRMASVERTDTAVRLFHGRGHCYPGFEDLTVDLYSSFALVASFADDAAGAKLLALQIAEALPQLQGVCLQVRKGRRLLTENVVNEVPESLVVTDGGLRYLVRPHRNQNVGLFLDMAPTRQWLRGRCDGKRLLNLFAYTCAFSVVAIAGGATCVVNNDMSRSALAWGRENHQLNAQDLGKVRMLPHDLFKSWSKIRRFGPYDTVVIDPPTNQRGSFNAEKQYGQVLKRLTSFCTRDAEVVACLNSPFLSGDFLIQQMARWCPPCQFIETLSASEDFPDQYPERGLKIAVFRFS